MWPGIAARGRGAEAANAAMGPMGMGPMGHGLRIPTGSGAGGVGSLSNVLFSIDQNLLTKWGEHPSM